MTRLRHYQRELQAGFFATWEKGARCVVGVTATGSGKTVTMADTARQLAERGAYGIVQAHRAELVGQLSIALAREGLRHNITASKKTVKAVVDAHLEETGRSFFDPRARWEVASVDTIIRRDHPWAEKINYVFTDECFPAGTLIDGVPIEQIKAGDTVRAFDETTGQIVPGRVVQTFRNAAPEWMVKVSVSHHVLECTNGHPFWTKRGWVPAAQLTTNDYVFISDLHAMCCAVPNGKRSAAISIQKDGAGVLHPSVRVCTQDFDAETPAKGGAPACGVCDVSADCRHGRAPSGAMEKDGAGVLQSQMFGCVSGRDICGNCGENESCTCFGKNDEAQPDAQRRSAGESVSNFEGCGACADCAGRQRETRDECRKDTGTNAGTNGVCPAICGCDGEAEGFGMAEPLQDRQRAPCVENSDRSGRAEPSDQSAQGAGLAQGCVSKWVRVGCVEVFKWADRNPDTHSDGGDFVYNFEVEKYHTYIAGGVVVHNCHHVLADNKWGRAIEMFPNARGLMMTATPTRADGKGLGRHHDGLADAMVIGPGLGDLIAQGYLAPYRVHESRASDLDMSDVHVTASGDYNGREAARAVKRSKKIVGDAVRIYNEVVSGKLAIVFCADIENATTMTEAFNAAGVPAALVTAETDESERRAIMRKFKARELKVLTNVDLFGEGVDVPAVEAVIMARPTASFSLYAQQIGRMLRLCISPILMAAWDTFTVEQRNQHIAESEKPFGVLIDLVGNIRNTWKIGDGDYKDILPEAFKAWTLDRRGRRRSGGGEAIPVRQCLECFQPYERIYDCCPYCGHAAPPPALRGGPETVDGNVYEIDPQTLAMMRGEVARIEAPVIVPLSLPTPARVALMKAHAERQHAQQRMKVAIAVWAGWYPKNTDAENYRRFYHTFGMDVLSALSLGSRESDNLHEKIAATIVNNATQEPT